MNSEKWKDIREKFAGKTFVQDTTYLQLLFFINSTKTDDFI